MHAPRGVITYPQRMHSACQSQPKNTNLRAVFLRFAPVLWPPSDLEVRGRKERRRKNNDKFSGHYVLPSTQNVCAHALRSHQLSVTFIKVQKCGTPQHVLTQLSRMGLTAEGLTSEICNSRRTYKPVFQILLIIDPYNLIKFSLILV